MALQQGKTKKAMENFRQTLIVDNDFQWDKDLNDETDARKLFEALRSEVKGLDVHSPKVPKKMGFAQAYVDGVRVRAGDWVAVGRRLAQIQCPEGEVFGLWTDFKEPVDWLALCPYEVDTTVDIYAVTGPSDDEFAGVGVNFASAASGDGTATPPSPAAVESESDPAPVVSTDEPASSSPMESEGSPDAEATESENAADTDAVVVADSGSGVESPDIFTPRNITIGVGSGMMIGGIVMHYAVVKPSFAMVEWGRANSDRLTRDQADTLTRRFVTRRFWTWTLFGVGAGVTASGALFLNSTNLQPKLVVLPGGIGLQGRFY